MSQDWEPAWQRPDDEVRPGGNALALDAEFADLVAYCGAVSGRESDAASTAHAVLDSVQPLLTDPDQLRAWLFALARRELLAAGEPPAREVYDLVHRHGILPEDLPVVLGIPPIEADELLADAEAAYGDEPGWDNRSGWEDRTDLIGRQQDIPVGASPGQLLDTQLDYLVGYCRSLTGREDDAVDTAHAVLDSSRSLLTDPDRRRAWLFALARQEMLADAPPIPEEILDLVHRHGIRAEDLPTVLGISAAEADELLAAAEDEFASSAFGSGRHQAAPDYSADWDDGAYADDRGYADDGGDWDDVFGPKSRLQDLYGRFRQPTELAGRHAARTSGGRLRQALARGPVRAGAAAAIVVAVIGVSAAYLAAANSPPPSQASQQTNHHPPASPAATPSPASTDTPTQSPAPSQSVSVVVPPPAPAPTSQRPSPKPSPKSSPPPTSPPPTSPPPSSPPPTPTPSASSP